MADKQPNYKLEIVKMRWQIQQQQTAIDKCLVDCLEAIERIRTAQDNLAAHRHAIADYQGKLADLEKTHGPITETEIEQQAQQAIKALG